MKRRWEFSKAGDLFYTFGHPAEAGLESMKSARISGVWRSL